MKFIIGLLSGLAVGLMLAPASGEETRERLMKEAGDMAEAPRKKAQEAINKGREKVGEIAKQKAEETYSSAIDKVSGGRVR